MHISRRSFNRGLLPAASLLASPLASASGSAAASTPQSMLALQQRFVDLRFGMFLHFNMATFQDREWGDPTSPVSLFHPTALDTDQWAAAAKSAKMTWACLTTRHHDGFCIWPTRTRAASVAGATPPLDIVRSYVDSFRKAGLRVALYYSILSLRDDIRHFNVTPAKIALIKAQLNELLTNYGPVDLLITDGWDAPWSRITYQEVPFREIYDHIKSLQPQCLVCDLNAANYPAGGLYYSDIKAYEQNAGQHVPAANDLPALSCVTITDGWFWKTEKSNGELKPANTVVNEWLVPLNQRHCNLILNAPPTREGILAPNVVARLKEIGELWTAPLAQTPVQAHTAITTQNLATAQPVHASSSPDTVGPDLANDGNFHSAWSPDDTDRAPWLEVTLPSDRRVSVVSVVQAPGEGTALASSIVVESWAGSSWRLLSQERGSSPVVIARIDPDTARRFRWRFEPGSAPPSIADIGLYDEPL